MVTISRDHTRTAELKPSKISAETAPRRTATACRAHDPNPEIRANGALVLMSQKNKKSHTNKNKAHDDGDENLRLNAGNQHAVLFIHRIVMTIFLAS
ncbi:MAG TPA: hypothetical protein VKA27_08620 [Sunxiuqinia sp.]|nr:hypothetical protein [Sunxiuqinia sp.]